MRLSFLLFVAAAATALIVPSEAAEPGVLVIQNNEAQEIFAERCVACHAQDGSGTTARGRAMKSPDLRSQEIQGKTDEQLLEGILKSKGHPAFEDQIGRDGIEKAITHIRTFKQASPAKD